MFAVESLMNLASKTVGSSPTNFTPFNGQAVFTASGSSGVEPYVTDGTRQGTRLLADIAPGTNSSASTNFLVIGRKLYFTAFSPGFGRELWISDGTTPGTNRVADLTAGSGSSNLSRFTASRSKLYFVLNNNLWQSDGTSTGTSQLWSNIANYQPVMFKNELYFVSNESGSSRLRAVASDGTIRLVTNVNVEPDEGMPSKILPFADHLYFSGKLGTAYELFRTDGTAAGTSLFFEANPNGSSSPKVLDASAGKMYFTVRLTGTLNGTLFVTDGTGTTQLSPVFGDSTSSPTNYVSWNSLFLYSFRDSAGNEPWVTDGTSVGTKRLLDIIPGSGSSSPSQFRIIDEVVYFVANSSWYSTDGTTAGTNRFLKAYPPTSPTTASGKRIASLNIDEYGPEPFAFDSANNNYELLRDLNTTPVVPTISPYFSAGGSTYFSLDNQAWRTDGTGTGTIPLGISGILRAAKIGPDGRTYLLISNKLYVTGETTQFIQLATFPHTATYLMFLADQVIVLTSIGVDSPLYSVNRDSGQGTPLSPLTAVSNSVMNTAANGRVFITGTAEGPRIYQTDGTPLGTTYFGALPYNSQSLYASIGYTSAAAYIVSTHSGTPIALYRVDGTSAGSYNLLAGISSSTSGGLIFKDQLVAFIGNGLYRTNATQTAIEPVGTFSGEVAIFGDADPRTAATDDRVFFIAGFNSVSEIGLWKTDESGANPVLVTSLNLPLNSPKRLFSTSHTLYFVDGTNLYTSDGSASGTVVVPGVAVAGYAASRAAIGDWLITYDARDAYPLLRIGDGPSAAIEGSMYFDDDGDGEWDATEAPASARTVFLDLNANGTLDADEPRQANAAGSGFRFGGLAPGTYVVRAVLESGEVQTSGLGSITLESGHVVSVSLSVRQEDFLPPALLAHQYDADQAAVELTFDDDVFLTPNAAVTLLNCDTQEANTIPLASITISSEWNRVTVALPVASLPDGHYKLMIAGDSLRDVDSNRSPEITQELFILAADATRDRIVNTADFNVLAGSFGGSAKSFSQGNFSYDPTGIVDSTDFNILVSQYGRKLSATTALPMPTPVPTLFTVISRREPEGELLS